MIRNDNGGFSKRQNVAGAGDLGAIDANKDELDNAPHGKGDVGGEMVDGSREESGERKQGGEEEIGDQEEEEKGRDKEDSTEVSNNG